MAKRALLAATLCAFLCLAGCGAGENGQTDNGEKPEPVQQELEGGNSMQPEQNTSEPCTVDTKITEVINDPVFEEYGRLIFPVDEAYYSGDTLGSLRLTWYNNINPEETVKIVNTLKSRAESGETVFYDIYTDEEKEEDPEKEDTDLFFFRGNPGEKFAVCSAGGGFAYVGAMQDSFPHALGLSERGYNAFALIYRPGAQTGCEDLARAISFIFEHADELNVDTDCYSLWGGSAGGRLSAWLGSYGPAAFGGNDLPRPGAVIMQYTGHSDYTANDPATFACVGESDGIADWRSMRRRINRLKASGIPTEFHHYPGLRHGFGLGTGTAALAHPKWQHRHPRIEKSGPHQGQFRSVRLLPRRRGNGKDQRHGQKKTLLHQHAGAPESICGDGSSGRRTEIRTQSTSF